MTVTLKEQHVREEILVNYPLDIPQAKFGLGQLVEDQM